MNKDKSLKLSPLAPDQWHSNLDPIIAATGGKPLNIHRMLAHHPDLLSAWWPFRNYAVRGGNLTTRDRELVILRVAHVLQSAYEWDSHVTRGIAAGLSADEIERARLGADTEGWTGAESALLAAVDDCLAHRKIRAPVLLNLAEHYTPQQVLDIIAIHSLYVMLATVIGTWGLELDKIA